MSELPNDQRDKNDQTRGGEAAPLPRSAQRVQDWLQSKGSAARVRQLPDSTRTAAEAAAACACEVAQIAKSLLFCFGEQREPLLVIASGSNRVDVTLVEREVAAKVERPDAAFVRDATGYAIGGIPPVAHRRPILTLMDADLRKWDAIWAAAGTPNSVFRITFDELMRLANPRVVRIC